VTSITKLCEIGGGNLALGVSLYEATVKLARRIIEIEAKITASLARLLDKPICGMNFDCPFFSRYFTAKKSIAPMTIITAIIAIMAARLKRLFQSAVEFGSGCGINFTYVLELLANYLVV
jgi:hypothetical protein